MSDNGPVTQAWDRFVANLPAEHAMAAHKTGLGKMIWELEFNARSAQRELQSALEYLSRDVSEDRAETTARAA